MFREMRRKKQELSVEESTAVLKKGTSGVLAVLGDEAYPYAVPLSYLYEKGKVYFHCAKSGHKLDAVTANAKVSFCVIDQDNVVPEKYTTYFRSVILFGKAFVLTDNTERRTALEKFSEKYSPSDRAGRLQEIKKLIDNTCIIVMAVEHMTGKEAIELVREKHI